MEEPLVSNESNGDSPRNNVNPTVVVAATLTLILSGLTLVALTMFVPSLLFLLSVSVTGETKSLPFTITIAIVQVLHLQLLWNNPGHLAFYRWLSLPVRRLLLPVVMAVCRLDSIREEESTLYLPTDDLQLNALSGKEKTALLMTFRQSVRRRHRQMEQLFIEAGIERRSIYSETHFNASELVPLIWQHERRQCAGNGKSVLEEFIKRFLVMTVVPDAILDVYYEDSSNNKPIAVQMSILQGNILHWFMYFAADSATKSGIWFQGILLSMARGHLMPNVKYVNGQTHHEESKRHAGFLEAESTESNLLFELYPWDSSTERISNDVLQFAGWENQTSS
mmetsp:Transcript_28318/g.65896  ORF Transcript_28318/g.65896 Transcript_28318/m.65896 type:complete len:337 (-) Transcript_28318:494-1504(-)